ncbi:hypothetical protein C672_1689 [[Clostridium] bifermentans ATCC 638]|uniref:Uncharacterized protein n=1 Tax=Paraclostridium bifermentans ATCC 638 = DSM 14991 TaxID=1233171 RepID=T4VNN8_PARBF|nr:hypothetical protein [Paraclostridium bifermentans]EQK42745.1 hypothetical protein C672_1689 [[Clostridium] bifermentans ATCC 638] [Paraclostridium bifermentans ATCC 638 = DSM 14991]UAG19544.1 hypothetical protein KXZ80_07495 [Paraclostridium bifermentans]
MQYIVLSYLNLFIATFNFLEEDISVGLIGGFGAIVFMLMAIYQKIEQDRK